MERIPFRIDIGLRDHATPQQRGNLVSIDLVILGLAPVNRLHVERVTQNESNSLAGAQIGQPVPRENAFDGDVLAERSDRFQKKNRDPPSCCDEERSPRPG